MGKTPPKKPTYSNPPNKSPESTGNRKDSAAPFDIQLEYPEIFTSSSTPTHTRETTSSPAMKPTLTTFQAKPKLPDLPPSYIDICSPFTPRAYSCCQCGNTQHELSFVKGKTVTSCPSLHDPRACIPSHNGETHGCHVWDHLSKPALTQRTPAVFLCATCNAEHSVHEILTQTTVTCECGAPSLEAVYDQFGTILLCPEVTPSVYDLRDAKKVVEARRRLREVGAMPWTEFEARLQEYFEVAGELELSDQVDKIEQSTKRFESSPKELGIRTEMSPSPSLSPSMSPSPSPPPSEEMSSLEEIKMVCKEAGFELFTAEEMKDLLSTKHSRGWSQVSGASVETEDSFDAELALVGMMNQSPSYRRS